jgi:hypothetical protein
MLTYRFVLRNDGGRRVEGLGSMGLTDDDEALTFGKRVIRDLMLGDQRFAGWMMDITAGERPVGSIPLELFRPRAGSDDTKVWVETDVNQDQGLARGRMPEAGSTDFWRQPN